MVLLKWAPSAFLIKNNVLIVSDLIQSWCLILGMSFVPPCLANI